MLLRIPHLASGLIVLLAIAVASPSLSAQDLTALERDSIATFGNQMMDSFLGLPNYD